MRRISLAITLIFAVLANGCASPKLVYKPLLVAPPLPERYLNGELLEYYPDASRRAHETGEVIVDFAVASDGKAENVTVNEQKSAPFPRLFKAATQIVQGLKLAVGDKHKTSFSMSIVFEIAPCGNVAHSPGPDYYTFLCIDPIRRPGDFAIPEFVHWYEAFDSKLRLDQQKLIRDEMNVYAKSVGLAALKANGPDELRVWVGHGERPAIAGFVVSNSLVRKCTLPVDSANSSAGHCTERKPRAGRRYFAPLKQLEPFNGHRFRCIPTSTQTPESDANIHIEWVDAGKRYAVRSNDPRVGSCLDKPSSLITTVLANAGWQTLP
jgi:TonB family protein